MSEKSRVYTPINVKKTHNKDKRITKTLRPIYIFDSGTFFGEHTILSFIFKMIIVSHNNNIVLIFTIVVGYCEK